MPGEQNIVGERDVLSFCSPNLEWFFFNYFEEASSVGFIFEQRSLILVNKENLPVKNTTFIIGV